jgi:S1-C subfamily serine protease
MITRWYAPGSVHQIVFEFLRLYCSHPDSLVSFGERYQEKHQNEKINPGTLRVGLVSKTQLISFLGETAVGGFGVGNELARIYDSLVQWDIFSELPFSDRGLMYDFRINFMNVAYYQARNVLENIVKGPGILPIRYYQAMVAIVVENGGNESLGSGSVVCHNGMTFILTNKHVLDPAAGTEFKYFLLGGAKHEPRSIKIIVSESDDLAAFPVDLSEVHPKFFLGNESFVLQDVILFGFPKIPHTASPHLTAHSGEINARIQTRSGEELYLISNYASPGSSGGALVDYRGLLVGVVSDRLEGQYEGDISLFQHSAAVTLSRVQRFVEANVIPTLSVRNDA